MAASLPGLLGNLAGQATDLVEKNGGGGVLAHLGGASAQAAGMARSMLEEYVPGGGMLLEQAESLLKSDVSGGFQLGHSVAIHGASMPGVEGWSMESNPDGTEYFISEESACCHFLCCWTGSGPKYHIFEGNPLKGKEVLTMTSHRLCCCTSPEIDVFSPNGDEVAVADEHGCLCCASTRVDVRDQETYRVVGHLCGICCGCCTASEHEIRTPEGHAVGSIMHGSSTMHIEFPEDARASDKAGLLAAVLLSELRSCSVSCCGIGG
mmetsp:Transcript_28319/g.64133  ORF Transcript_28319/g.64133 Transcript_28319/m.64133 type:complete len:265 (+) Transcript_28319:55-849(+)|eukprot:CAMPEP_0197894158 /NCGR_PEP_ID=MMETSP1439-20131203/34547_1 /TAXON_ID=66791 /ORGANISM="Gonyaulax spinifera, Strain CCMP409" /LENGTH=264 /DNA_ID=CAMNT_0043514479 /DNA_START=55 /DNA_END=849 /DNA_ORIENTATION=+